MILLKHQYGVFAFDNNFIADLNPNVLARWLQRDPILGVPRVARTAIFVFSLI